MALLYPELQLPLQDCRLLDLGSGLGTISIPAAKFVRSVLGIDFEPTYVERAREWAERDHVDNVTFRVGNAAEVDAGRFDIVLCDYVLEHIREPDRLIASIASHLERAGAFYLSTNNRWWPLEGHYGLPLPFIPWLPRRLADRYVRILGFGETYDVYPVSWASLRQLLNRHGLTWALKPPAHPYTIAQKIGRRLVALSPRFWTIANVFQVVGRRADRS